MRTQLQKFLFPIPWTFIVLGAIATLIQLCPSWRDGLIYTRDGLVNGEFWRLWTGNFCHFGWMHFIADTGLFLLLGRVLEREYPRGSRLALLLMPVVISAGIYLFDPSLSRYAGLSGINVGLLVFLACKNWQNKKADWFWPAVLGVHVLEVVLEATQNHGVGGAMIPFDEVGIRVATSAHLVGAAYAISWLVLTLTLPLPRAIKA